jgi:integrase
MKAGHVRERSPGRWELRWRAGIRVRTATVSAKSERDAEKQLAIKVAAAERGVVANAPARLLFGDYLDRWLRGHNVKPLTAERYETTCRLYLKPDLGHIALRNLSAADIREAFRRWHTTGRDGGEPLAKSTLASIRVVLSAALSCAVVDDLIAANPMAKLRKRLPTGAAPPVQIPSPEEVARILQLDVDSPYHTCLILAAAGGLRRGEALGLRWRSVDLKTGEIRITETLNRLRDGLARGETKTGKERKLTLPGWAIEELRQAWRRNAETMLSLGSRLGPDHPVCAWGDGRPVLPTSFSNWCGLHGFSVHSLRHYHASTLLQAGVPPTAVAARLGHTVAVLLSTYAHAMPDDDARIVAVLDKAFSSSSVANGR